MMDTVLPHQCQRCGLAFALPDGHRLSIHHGRDGTFESDILQDPAPNISICHRPKEAAFRICHDHDFGRVPIDAFHCIANRRVGAHQNFIDRLHIVEM